MEFSKIPWKICNINVQTEGGRVKTMSNMKYWYFLNRKMRFFWIFSKKGGCCLTQSKRILSGKTPPIQNFIIRKKNWHPNWLCGGGSCFFWNFSEKKKTVFLCLPLVALLLRNLVNHPPRVGKPCCTFCNEIFWIAVTPLHAHTHFLKIHRFSPQNYCRNLQWIYWDIKWSYHFGSVSKIHPNLRTPAALTLIIK